MEKAKSESEQKEELATLGGGCFWCTEAVFVRLKGVISVMSGYSGGSVENPTYDQVSMGKTGHAEVVQVKFNPKIISFKEILEVFFTTHDPTTLNRQGADIGTQYRSIILYHSEEQRRTAEAYIKELEYQKKVASPIVTQVKPFKVFYEAEEFHKDYYEKNRDNTYSSIVIAPKVEKLKKYPSLLKNQG